jgi:ribosome-interacting GTPase 1
MPANLTPVYKAAEQRFRAAKTLPERIAALQEMLAVIPKHKGTEHMRADLRSRLAKLQDELEAPPAGKRGAPSPWSIRKEGAGRVVLMGAANAGKSALMARLTGAAARVAAYPHTTDLPLPGVLNVGGAHIQMIDTPPLVPGHTEPAYFGLLRTADAIVSVVDLSADPVAQFAALCNELAGRGLVLRGADGAAVVDGAAPKRAVVAATKADIPGALDALPALEAAADGLPVVPVSVDDEFGLDDLGAAVFGALDMIRVFTKAPGQEPDRAAPVVLPAGGTVLDFAEALHRGWERRLKYAVLWGASGRFAGQRVGKEHVLADGDALELHA